VKRGTERSFNPDFDQRDAAPAEPLLVERLSPLDRRRSVGVPVLAGIIFVIALVALGGRAVSWYETVSEVTPAPATPISWVDTVVVPAGSATAASVATLPGLPTLSPSGPTAFPSLLPSVTADATSAGFLWTAGQPNHFTVNLTNTTSRTIRLSPCPTYRMYVLGTPAIAAVVRAMNCVDMGVYFAPGQVMSLDMVYTPPATDPRGFQTIEWEAISGFQATALLASIDIGD